MSVKVVSSLPPTPDPEAHLVFPPVGRPNQFVRTLNRHGLILGSTRKLPPREQRQVGPYHGWVAAAYQEFAEAPAAVVKRFEARFLNPSLSSAGIERRKAVPNELASSLSKDPNPVEKINALIELVNTLDRENGYAVAAYKRFQHGKEPPDKTKWGLPHNPHLPFSDVTRLTLYLVRGVSFATILRDELLQLGGEKAALLARKITRGLDREELKDFTAARELLRDVSGGVNPHRYCSIDALTTYLHYFDPSIDYTKRSPTHLGTRSGNVPHPNGKSRPTWVHHYDFGPNRRLSDIIFTLEQLRELPEAERKQLDIATVQLRKLEALCSRIMPRLADPAAYCEEHQHQKASLLGFVPGLLDSALYQLAVDLRLAKMMVQDSAIFAHLTPDGPVDATPRIKLEDYADVILASHLREMVPAPGPSDSLNLLFALLAGDPVLQEEPFSPRPHPFSINLAGESLVLSGSNMSGKTTALRGIVTALREHFAAVPFDCREAVISGVKRIFVAAPPANQVEGSWGCFVGGVDALYTIGSAAGKGDVVLIDELPSGSTPDATEAIGYALIKRIVTRGATVLLAHHGKRLLRSVAGLPNVIPLQFITDVDQGRFKPTYRTEPGVTITSNAIDLMRAIGFSPRVVTEAAAVHAKKLGLAAPLRDDAEQNVIVPPETDERSMISELPGIAARLYPERLFVIPDSFERVLSLVKALDYPDSENRESSQSIIGALMDDSGGLTRISEGLKGALSILGTLVGQDPPERAILYVQLQTALSEIERILPPDPSLNLWRQSFDGLSRLLTRTAGSSASIGDGEPLDAELAAAILRIPLIVRELLGDIDFHTGLARAAKENDLYVSVHRTDRSLSCAEQRPLDTAAWQDGSPMTAAREALFIPTARAVLQNIELRDPESLLYLQGPNASGKSMLTFCLAAYAELALKRFPVPAKLEIGSFDRIEVFSGGRTRSEVGQSLFGNVLVQLRGIVERSGPGTLVIMDEILGSDPDELAAIQITVTNELRRKGAKVIYNTNIPSDPADLFEPAEVAFWHTEYKLEGDTFRPLYQLRRQQELFDAEKVFFNIIAPHVDVGVLQDAVAEFDRIGATQITDANSFRG